MRGQTWTSTASHPQHCWTSEVVCKSEIGRAVQTTILKDWWTFGSIFVKITFHSMKTQKRELNMRWTTLFLKSLNCQLKCCQILIERKIRSSNSNLYTIQQKLMKRSSLDSTKQNFRGCFQLLLLLWKQKNLFILSYQLKLQSPIS